MKVLSIRQPWAAAIIHAGKDIENRVWATNVRGPILVHATRWASEKEFDDDFAFIEKILPDYLLFRIAGSALSFHPSNECRRIGQIIGQVDILDCVRRSKSRWFFGPHGFVLANAIPCEPIIAKGRLGFWEHAGAVHLQPRENRGFGR